MEDQFFLIFIFYLHMCVYVCVCICVCLYVCMYVCVCIHIYTHICTHSWCTVFTHLQDCCIIMPVIATWLLTKLEALDKNSYQIF